MEHCTKSQEAKGRNAKYERKAGHSNLYKVVDDHDRCCGGHEDRGGVGDDDEHTEDREQLLHEHQHQFGHLRVQDVHVPREAIHHAAKRRCVEEVHWLAHDVRQHGCMQLLRGHDHTEAYSGNKYEGGDTWESKHILAL